MRKGKNSHGQGGVRKIKDGKYQVYFRIPDPDTGRTKRQFVRVDAETQRDALKEKARLEQQYKGIYGKHTFGEVAEQFLKIKERTTEPTTTAWYKSSLNTVWLPELGHKQLKKITDRDIEHVIDQYANQSFNTKLGKPSEKTIHGHYRSVRTLLKWCVKKKLIPYSPCETVDAPTMSSNPEVTIVPTEWIDKLINACENHEERTLITIYCLTGMRLAEAFGIRMTDVNYEDNTINVSVQARKGHITELKGHNKKILGIPPSLADMLKQQEIDIKKRKLELGKYYQDNNLLFPEPNGQPFKSSHTWSRKMRMRAGWIPCNRCVNNDYQSGHDCAQRPGYTIHDIRHTVGTKLAGKIDLFIVQKILGHKSIQTTQDFYVGQVTPDQRQATAVLEDYFGLEEAN